MLTIVTSNDNENFGYHHNKYSVLQLQTVIHITVVHRQKSKLSFQELFQQFMENDS